MNLRFPPFDRAEDVAAWPGDLDALIVGVAARQAGSPTAMAQAVMPAPSGPDPRPAEADPRSFAPGDGAFNGGVAAAITRWKET